MAGRADAGNRVAAKPASGASRSSVLVLDPPEISVAQRIDGLQRRCVRERGTFGGWSVGVLGRVSGEIR